MLCEKSEIETFECCAYNLLTPRARDIGVYCLNMTQICSNLLHINSLAPLSSFTDFQKGNNKSGLEIFSSLLPHAPDWRSQKVNLKNTSNWISCALWLWGYIQILKLNSNLYQNIPDCMRSNLQNKWMWTNKKHTL